MLKVILASAAALASANPEQFDLERAKYVEEINNTPGILWKAAAHDRFKGQPLGASKTLCGALPTSPEEKERLIASGLAERGPTTVNVTLPDNFDSATNWPVCADVINDIRDQSACGCCWAFGAAEAASDRMCIATKGALKMPLSAQDTCFCAESSGCNGGQLYTAWSYISRKGLVTGGQYGDTGALGGGWCSAFSLPHCHHHGPQGSDPYPAEGTKGCPNVERSPRCPRSCDKGANSTHSDFSSDKYTFDGRVTIHSDNEQSIMQSIMTDGPVEAAFTVYKDFENYSGGIYHQTSDEQLGGHAIRIVGWGVEDGTKFWKVANSWNPYWGEKGYFRIKKGTDECGIESDVVSSSSRATWAKKNSQVL